MSKEFAVALILMVTGFGYGLVMRPYLDKWIRWMFELWYQIKVLDKMNGEDDE